MAFRFRLIPRNEDFYADFIALADRAARRRRAARGDAGAAIRPIWDKADEIKEVEHSCDHLTHQIIQRLNTHVRHADRPRGHPRAGQVARRRDGRDRRVGEVVRLYRIETVRYGARELARVVSLERRSGAAGARGAGEAHGRRRARRRDQPPRERGRPVHEEALQPLFDEERDAG